MKIFDAAIVGGGIAGASAAIALAATQTKENAVAYCFAWIAPAATRDTQTDRIGESLSPSANPILNRLGLSDILASDCHREANLAFASWGTDKLVERNAATNLNGAGLLLDRPVFEQQIRTKAEACNLTNFSNSLKKAVYENELWQIELEDGTRLISRYIIDCTGRAALISRGQTTLNRSDQMVAAYTFLAQDCEEVEPTPATLIEAVENGWWYAALLPDKRLALAYFSDPGLLPERLSQDTVKWQQLIAETHYISRWLEDAGFAVNSPPAISSAGTTWLTDAAGPGWLAVGDAASAFDPLSSHGMTTALWGAEQAANAVTQALAGHEEAIQQYASKVSDGINGFLKQRQAMYRRETRFPDSVFWQARR